MSENELNFKYLELLLKLGDCLSSGDAENTKTIATELGKLELNDEQENTVSDIVRLDYEGITDEDKMTIIENLNLKKSEIIQAIIETDIKLKTSNGMTPDEIKQLRAYKVVTSGIELDNFDKYNLLNSLVILSIQSRDRALMKELLDILNQ